MGCLKIGLIAAVLAALVSSGPDESVDEEDIFQITGLVVDETKTKVGDDFFFAFTENWDPPNGEYSVRIHELPDVRLGNIISIYVNDTVIYKRRVSPRSSDVEESAMEAVNVTQDYILRKMDLQQELEMY
jgi:curli production assembly/transport component CsgE